MGKVRLGTILSISWSLLACSSPSDDPSTSDHASASDSSLVDVSAEDTPQRPDGSCTNDAMCASLLASVTPVPPGCAEAYCAKASGTCGLRPVDADGDGFRTATCDVPGFASFDKGTDCDDTDKLFSPGKSRDCSTGTDGKKISWPTGIPEGECKYGKETCGSTGKSSSCLNAVAPTEWPDCTSEKDSTCDGRADWMECGDCRVGETKACYSGPTGTRDKGSCHAGLATCVVSAADSTKSVWGPCVGEAVPASTVDSCDASGRDDNCNGIANEACACVKGGAGDGSSCGPCSLGKQACVGGPSPGGYGGCSVPPGVCTTGSTSACTVCGAAEFSAGSTVCGATCAAGACVSSGGVWAHDTDWSGWGEGCAAEGPTGFMSDEYSGRDATLSCFLQTGPGVSLPKGRYRVTLSGYHLSYDKPSSGVCSYGTGPRVFWIFPRITRDGVRLADGAAVSGTATDVERTATVDFTVSESDCSHTYDFKVDLEVAPDSSYLGCFGWRVLRGTTTVTFLGP